MPNPRGNTGSAPGVDASPAGVYLVIRSERGSAGDTPRRPCTFIALHLGEEEEEEEEALPAGGDSALRGHRRRGSGARVAPASTFR